MQGLQIYAEGIFNILLQIYAEGIFYTLLHPTWDSWLDIAAAAQELLIMYCRNIFFCVFDYPYIYASDKPSYYIERDLREFIEKLCLLIR